MPRGGYRPNSGPIKGTKYRSRINAKKAEVKVPKKRGRPCKVKVDKVVKVIVTPAVIPEFVKPEPITSPPTSLLPEDIVVAAEAKNLTPLEYLLSIMNNSKEDQNIRIRVAGMVAPFIHPKPGDERKGKKDEQVDKAVEAGQGKFKAGRAPLALVK